MSFLSLLTFQVIFFSLFFSFELRHVLGSSRSCSFFPFYLLLLKVLGSCFVRKDVSPLENRNSHFPTSINTFLHGITYFPGPFCKVLIFLLCLEHWRTKASNSQAINSSWPKKTFVEREQSFSCILWHNKHYVVVNFSCFPKFLYSFYTANQPVCNQETCYLSAFLLVFCMPLLGCCALLFIYCALFHWIWRQFFCLELSVSCCFLLILTVLSDWICYRLWCPSSSCTMEICFWSNFFWNVGLFVGCGFLLCA